MELIFNEQSVVPCADDLSAACSAVIQFIKTYKEAEKHELGVFVTKNHLIGLSLLLILHLMIFVVILNSEHMVGCC